MRATVHFLVNSFTAPEATMTGQRGIQYTVRPLPRRGRTEKHQDPQGRPQDTKYRDPQQARRHGAETTTKNYNNFVFATQRPHDVLRETTTKKNYNPQGAGRLLYDLERKQ